MIDQKGSDRREDTMVKEDTLEANAEKRRTASHPRDKRGMVACCA